MGKTSIEWTDASWNPIVGCTEVSPGCANCYAARLAGTRLKGVAAYNGLTARREFCDEHRVPLEAGRCPQCRDANGNTFVLDMQSKVLSRDSRWTDEIRFLPERLEEPLHWREPRRIFVCDMGDLFHESVSVDWIFKVWGIMASCPQHTFQILTKRADRLHHIVTHVMNHLTAHTLGPLNAPLRNVWLGVSVENQHFADQRIPLLLATPAAVRWISAEPLLGNVDLNPQRPSWPLPQPFLDWVVCGGESGPQARQMQPDWARSLRDQCRAAGVPFFFKQWGEWIHVSQIEAAMSKKEIDALSLNTRCRAHGPEIFFKVGKKRAGRILDGSDWNEFPKWPAVERRRARHPKKMLADLHRLGIRGDRRKDAL